MKRRAPYSNVQDAQFPENWSGGQGLYISLARSQDKYSTEIKVSGVSDVGIDYCSGVNILTRRSITFILAREKSCMNSFAHNDRRDLWNGPAHTCNRIFYRLDFLGLDHVKLTFSNTVTEVHDAGWESVCILLINFR